VRLLERVRGRLIGRDKVSQKIPFHHSSLGYWLLLPLLESKQKERFSRNIFLPQLF